MNVAHSSTLNTPNLTSVIQSIQNYMAQRITKDITQCHLASYLEYTETVAFASVPALHQLTLYCSASTDARVVSARIQHGDSGQSLPCPCPRHQEEGQEQG